VVLADAWAQRLADSDIRVESMHPGWVDTRPESTPHHFWHDRAQRPTTFGWQRGQDPDTVARFLDAVASKTGTMSFAAGQQD
jgi:dehydrogenase/reductase SDR family member 12